MTQLRDTAEDKCTHHPRSSISKGNKISDLCNECTVSHRVTDVKNKILHKRNEGYSGKIANKDYDKDNKNPRSLLFKCLLIPKFGSYCQK